MWVPEARLHAAGAGKWAGWSQAALKALPASETLGTTRTLPLPLRCQQTLWRGWRPLGSRGRRGPPGQQDSQRGWRWVVVGARKRSPLGGERGGTGCDVALAPCLGWGLSSFPLLRPAAALRPRTRPVPAAPTSPWVPADVFSNSWGGGPPYTQQGRGHGGREKRLPRAARTLGARAGSDPVSCSAPPWALNLRCPRFWTPPPTSPHGSQARRPGLCHPTQAQSPPPSGNWRADLACPWDLGSTGPCGWRWLSAVCRPVCNPHVGSGVQVPRAAPPNTFHSLTVASSVLHCHACRGGRVCAVCPCVPNGETEAGVRPSGAHPLRTLCLCGCLQAGSPDCICSWHG